MNQKLTLFIFLSSASILRSHEHGLVNMAREYPSITLDMRYATSNNCVHRPVSSKRDCYLHKIVARALYEAQQELEQYGLRLVIYDGYQPKSVRRAIWQLMPNEEYITHPDKEDDHSRGFAVDVSLLTLDGKPVDMGTDFDCLTDEAKRSCMTLDIDILAQRALLDMVMQKHGFRIKLDESWWHYAYKTAQWYPELDVEFEDLD